MKIRVLSDLHLEFDTPATIPHAEADLVVLAGDIHNHAQGIHWANASFDTMAANGRATPIVYVAGNHEYYDGEFGALDAALGDAAEASPNLHYLNNSALVDPMGAWRVLGSTLWADFTLFGSTPDAVARARAAAQRVMYDFNGVIQVARPAGEPPAARAFGTADSIDLHRQARVWLAAELTKPFAGQTIVVTHHAPHRLSLAERYADDLVSAGFVNHLPALFESQPALWIHGHTHSGFDYRVGATRVICNPRGYPARRGSGPENPSFRWDYVVEI